MDDHFHDELVAPGTPDLPARFFDRFVLNLHPTDATVPSVLLGLGSYPGTDTVDGFAIVSTDTEQRNLRFSTELSATDGASCGPFAWQVLEPMTRWRITLGPNPTGLELDATWHARTPAWTGQVAVTNSDGTPSSFDHLFQSGTWTGALTLDGVEQDVSGWWGQRDRSRGVRTMAGGQGLHVWFQGQLPDRSVGFLLVEDRQGGRLLLEGAVMHTDGRLDPITDVRHRFAFEALDLRSGTVEVSTAAGEVLLVDVDAGARGGYLAGGGYGGHHGKPAGRDHLEHDTYPLDGSVGPATLDSSLTDRLCVLRCTDGTGSVTQGSGIVEFALTRSRSYTYRPTLG